MPRDSRPGWENTVIFDKTYKNSQKWLFTNEGKGWRIKNAGTELSLHFRETVRDSNVDQNFYDGSDFYKWEPIDLGDGVIMLKAYRKDDRGDEYYMTLEKANRDTEVFLRKRNDANPKSQRWYLLKTDAVNNNEFTKERANEIGRDYLNKYWVNTRQSDGSYVKSLGGGFWPQAEMCEMLIDGWETLGESLYRTAFDQTYKDELDNIGNRYPYWQGMTEEDWRDNPFNDDIMWLVLASIRAYLNWGNGQQGFTNYLKYARNNFQTVIDRGMKPDGTIQWSHEAGRGNGTTSCINGPATVAACYLAKATGDENYYYGLAKKIHSGQRPSMFNAETGQVYDSPTNTWPSCYNQGTWIGACVMLYEHFHDRQYFDDAKKAMDFLIKKDGHFTDKYGILQQENDPQHGDLRVFRSILFRYVRKFITTLGREVDTKPYVDWMKANAKVTYNNRNNIGVVQTPFNHATANDMDFESAGMSGGVSLAFNMIW